MKNDKEYHIKVKTAVPGETQRTHRSNLLENLFLDNPPEAGQGLPDIAVSQHHLRGNLSDYQDVLGGEVPEWGSLL